MKRVLSKYGYVLFTVGLACYLIWSAVPCHLITSIVTPLGFITMSAKRLLQIMNILIPVVAFIGAVTTLHKKVTVEDVFINCSIGLILLLTLKAVQFYWGAVAIVYLVMVGCCIISCKNFLKSGNAENMSRAKRIRICYYRCRKCFTYWLLLGLTPLCLLANSMLYSSEKYSALIIGNYNPAPAKEQETTEESFLDLVTEEEWSEMNVNDRFEVVLNLTTYCLDELGAEHVPVQKVQTLDDNLLGYYNPDKDVISFSICHIAECTLEDAIDVVAHECYHKYEHTLIDFLTTMEEAGIDYSPLPYFEEAIALREANDNYEKASSTYSGYRNNLLEVRSRQYAEELIEEFKEKGVLR